MHFKESCMCSFESFDALLLCILVSVFAFPPMASAIGAFWARPRALNGEIALLVIWTWPFAAA